MGNYNSSIKDIGQNNKKKKEKEEKEKEKLEPLMISNYSISREYLGKEGVDGAVKGVYFHK